MATLAPFERPLEGRDEFPLGEVYVTRSRFWWGGKCVLGPAHEDRKFWACISTLLFLQLVIYTLLWDVLLPAEWQRTRRTVLALFVFVALAALRLRFTDPGIVPYRRDEGEVEYGVWNGVEEELSYKDIMVGKHTTRVNWCDTCQIFRPLRASHCPICDNCVLRYDHHCAWLGTCVGERNYKFYFAFLVPTAALVLFFASRCIAYLYQAYLAEETLWVIVSEKGITVLCIVLLALAVPLSKLACAHLYLVATNTTTREYMQRKNMSAFAGNFMGQLWLLLCSHRPAPNDFTEMVDMIDWDSLSTESESDIDDPRHHVPAAAPLTTQAADFLPGTRDVQSPRAGVGFLGMSPAALEAMIDSREFGAEGCNPSSRAAPVLRTKGPSRSRPRASPHHHHTATNVAGDTTKHE